MVTQCIVIIYGDNGSLFTVLVLGKKFSILLFVQSEIDVYNFRDLQFKNSSKCLLNVR